MRAKLNTFTLQKNRTIIIFLLKFFVTYFILSGIYSIYLKQTQEKINFFSCSPITKTVANHVQQTANILGYDAYVEQNSNELSMKLMLNDKYVSRIIEGCSSISVIILFLSFIIAFAGSLKATIIFGLFGSIMIYVVNILRIIVLGILYYRFPKYQDVLHDLLFPAVIYGLTFILWITWVKFYSNINKNEASKTV